jgi:hypothetical protein
MERLPAPRGPVSELLLETLPAGRRTLRGIEPPMPDEPLADEDLQLSLYLCYELHYRGLPGVDDRWEWDPSLLALRGALEEQFEQALLEALPLLEDGTPADEMDLALRAVADQEGPALSTYVQRQATVAQVREFGGHRAAYQL